MQLLNRESSALRKNLLFATDDPVAAWNIGVAMIRGGFNLYLINDLRDVAGAFEEVTVDIFVVDISTLDARADFLPEQAKRFDTPTQTVLLNARGDNTIDGRLHASDETALVLNRETPPEFLVNALRNFDAFIVSMRRKLNAESLGATLSEGASRQDGGEVVVRSGCHVGKIFFFSGKIAWATTTSQKSTLVDDLVHRAGLSKQDMRAVFAECKMFGLNFAETLVEWRIVERNLMRQILRDRIISCILEMSRWKKLQSIFVPQSRTYSSTLLFDMAELVGLLPETLTLHMDVPLLIEQPIAGGRLQ